MTNEEYSRRISEKMWLVRRDDGSWDDGNGNWQYGLKFSDFDIETAEAQLAFEDWYLSSDMFIGATIAHDQSEYFYGDEDHYGAGDTRLDAIKAVVDSWEAAE